MLVKIDLFVAPSLLGALLICVDVSIVTPLSSMVILGSLSCLHLSAAGFMGTVSVGLLITFLTCTVNLCSINNISHLEVIVETKN